MLKKISFIGLASLFLLSSLSCKKGKDDPFVSFRSRKARLSGNWKLERGFFNYTSNNPGSASTATSYEFSKEAGLLFINGSQVSQSVTFFINLIIEDDGKFELRENYGNASLVARGKWNFTGKIGKAKNKDGIIFLVEEVRSGDCKDHLFNFFSTNFIYNIRELRNKKIVLQREYAEYLNADGKKTEISANFEFRR